MTRSRVLPALTAMVLTIAALWPSALALPQHGDERMYVWKAGYYGGRIARLDFSPAGDMPYLDPGWDPLSFWAVEQPLGAHLIYALAMGLTRTPPPSQPYCWGQELFRGEETAIPPDTLLATRLAAVTCASLGLALIAYRLGWAGTVAAALFLAIPHVRGDLARAWAEGPLLLGFGISAIAYGSVWFPVTAGITTAFKLTGLALWPLAFLYHPIGRSRWSHITSIGVTWLTWSLASPISWLCGGPFHLLVLIAHRVHCYAAQCSLSTGWLGKILAQERVFGLFLPTRYLWPLELGGLLFLAHRGAKWIAARKARIS